MTSPKPIHVFHSSIHPERHALFKADAPPKSMIKEGRKEATMACTKCGQKDEPESPVKKCSGCKLAYYCSESCQRADWPVHKPNCSSELGEGIHPLIKSVTGNPMISHYIQVCLALEFSLHRLHTLPAAKRRLILRAPLSVHIDVGIEPTKIADFMNLYTYPEEWDSEDMDGMLQFHHLSNPDSWEPRRQLAPKDIAIWKEARKDADEDGEEDCAVVLVQFVNDFKQCITCLFVVGDEALGQARRNMPFTMCSAITGKEVDHPLSVASCFEYLNTHIRADKKNQLLLRAPMRPADKELIRNAGRQIDAHAPRMLRLKMAREHVYKSFSLDFVVEAAKERMAESSSSSSSGTRRPLPVNRQVEVAPPTTEGGEEQEAQDRPEEPEGPKLNRAARRRLHAKQLKEAKRRK